MKLSTVLLPFTLGNRIPDFIVQEDGRHELKYGDALCESDDCPRLDESISNTHEIIVGDISTTSCSTEYKNSFLSGRLDRCEYYNPTEVECVKWVGEELDRTCGGQHNCVQTTWSGTSGWGHYWGYSSRSVLDTDVFRMPIWSNLLRFNSVETVLSCAVIRIQDTKSTIQP